VRLEESKYKDKFEAKIVLPEGNFYIFKKFVVGEVAQDVHFNWELAQIVLEKVYDYLGSRDVKMAYISNRVNAYSVHPQDWLQFYKERHHLEAFAVVAYNKIGFMNVVLEKIFSQTRIRKFSELEKAVQWVEQLSPGDQVVIDDEEDTAAFN